MEVVLAVRLRARAGSEEAVWEVLGRLAEASRAEPGCVRYDPCRSTDDPAAFFLYERYVDRAALDTHWATDHFRKLAQGELTPLLEERERALYEHVLG
jgi:quinol monooxygenase YgiN